MNHTHNELVIFSGNANKELSLKICEYLNISLGEAMIGKFNDGETRIEIESSVRGKDVFIVQSTCTPANENIMELLIFIDALRRSSAQRITAVIPYYGYGRQERKSAPRTPITAKLIADLLTTAGVNRIVTIELHTGAIQGFFNIPVDHLYSKPVFFEHLSQLQVQNPIMVSPDAGGVERARGFAKIFNCGLAIVDKRRDKPGDSKVMNVIGDVTDKTAILLDDICDTATTLTSAARELKLRGALKVYAAITHPVFSKDAVKLIEESAIDTCFVTDTISIPESVRQSKKIHVLSVANLLGEAIKRIHTSTSVTSLFI